MTIFERAVEQIAPHLRPGALVVLRSTVYPGTSAFVAQNLADRGLSADVAFCPERIAEGHALEELSSLPQIVGADAERAGDRAEALFRKLTDHIVRTSTKEAELAKLFTNTWRYMKFAIANQFFMVADQAGVDYNNVLRAIREDYPRAADLPGPGFAAGPCLFKDTMQLAAAYNNNFWLGHAAMLVNEGLPAFVVRHVKEHHDLSNMRVGILGMAFKADSDDPRESLSYKLRKLLEYESAEVLCTDVYIQDPRFLPLDEVLERADLIIVGAPHREYRTLEFPEEMPVVDIWNIYGKGSNFS
jgi:UDP-N-acetyl-D-mannosaminuronic acid dehydrogenase